MPVIVIRNDKIERTDYRFDEKMFNSLFMHIKRYIPTIKRESIILIGNDTSRNEFAIYLSNYDGLSKTIGIESIETDSNYDNNLSIKINKLTGEIRVKEYFTYNKFNSKTDIDFFLVAKYKDSDDITFYYFDDGNEETVKKTVAKMSKAKTNAITFDKNGKTLYESTYINTGE